MEVRELFEYFSPGRQEELEMVYGPTVTSWENVKNWNNVVIKEQKSLISDLDAENTGKERCPHLRKLDDYFYFCKKRADCLEKLGLIFTSVPEPNSAQYNSHVNHFTLQLWCMQQKERYCKCVDFKSQDIEES